MNEDELFENARRNLFPKMKESGIAMAIIGEPDPKLCLEIGAMIMFDKPIMVVVPRGRSVPLALRTIAHKIVEISNPPTPADQDAMMVALSEMKEIATFRKGARNGD